MTPNLAPAPRWAHSRNRQPRIRGSPRAYAGNFPRLRNFTPAPPVVAVAANPGERILPSDRLEPLLQHRHYRTTPHVDAGCAVRRRANAMSCTKHFLNLKWEHHHWRPRVTFTETLTHLETDMWARDVYRDHVRCHKQYVCEDCGAIREEASCLCDMKRADQCPPRLDWLEESQRAPK
jgi:hypothetical protein